jgi:WD40 repeat protein
MYAAQPIGIAVEIVAMKKTMPEIPGHYWDESRNRYFKIDKNNPQTVEFLKPKLIKDVFQMPSIIDYTFRRQYQTVSGKTQLDVLNLTKTPHIKHSGICGKSILFLPEIYGNFCSVESNILSIYEIAGDKCNPTLQKSRKDLLFSPDISRVSLATATQHYVLVSLWNGSLYLVQYPSDYSGAYHLDDSPIAYPIREITTEVSKPAFTSIMNGEYICVGGARKFQFRQSSNLFDRSKFHTVKCSADVLTMEIQDHVLYYGDRDGFVVLYDLEKQREIKRFSFGNAICSIAVNEGYIIASTLDGRIARYDLGNEKSPVCVYNFHKNECTSNLNLYMDENYLMSGGNDAKVRIWDVTTGALLHSLKFDGNIYSIIRTTDSFFFGSDHFVTQIRSRFL